MKTSSSARFQGKPILKGAALGVLYFYEEPNQTSKNLISKTVDSDLERQRYLKALTITKKELFILCQRLEEASDHESVKIFSAHLMFLDDSLFTSQVEQVLIKNRCSSEEALSVVLEKMFVRLSNVKDLYFQDRIIDMKDLEKRIVMHLRGTQPKISDEFQGAIVCLEELTPSLAAEAVLKGVKGFITKNGSQASHTTVVLKGHSIPHLLMKDLDELKPFKNHKCLLDADLGCVTIDPTLIDLKAISSKSFVDRCVLHSEVKTIDNKTIRVLSTYNGAEFSQELYNGIGLFRTEFLLLEDKEFAFCKLSQIHRYQKLLEKIPNQKIVFRLFDLGGDKNFIHDTSIHARQLRSIQYLLARKEILSLQIESLIEAANGRILHILIPYVTQKSDIVAVKEVVHRLNKKNSVRCLVGAMIESLIDEKKLIEILKEADFIAVGTNDLTQALIEIHRDSPEFCSFQPVLFDQIRRIISLATRYEKDVSICGEIISNPVFTELLVGLGALELACPMQEVSLIKSRIQKVDTARAKKLANLVCEMKSSCAVKKLLLQAHEPAMC